VRGITMQVTMKYNLSMKPLLIAFFLISGHTRAFAITDKDQEVMEIAKVLPTDFANYQKQVVGDNGAGDCQATFQFISKAKEILGKPTENKREKENRNKTYYASWRLCIRMYHNTNDTTVKQMILEHWNHSLKNDDKVVPFQIYAISEPLWDKSFLTEDFWKLLQRTIQKKTISAISFIVYQRGDEADMKRLEQKRDSGIDFELQGIIQNAINWMNYRFRGDKTYPGPAAIGPTMDFHDDFLARTEMIIPMKAIPVTASAEDKQKMDKLLDLLENELKKEKSSVSRQVAIGLVGGAVFINKMDVQWGRDLFFLQPHAFDPNTLPIPYDNDRAIKILTQCLDHNDWQVRAEAIRWLGSIGANDFKKAYDVVALLEAQLAKEKAGTETEKVKVEREKSISHSLERLNQNQNIMEMKEMSK